MDTQFKPGDVVQLKSGGPKMTVSKPDEGYGYQCQWFVANDLKAAMFEGRALKTAPQEQLGT